MEAVLSQLGKSIYDCNGHNGFIIRWKLVAPFCKKWSRNRDPDMERVNEMIDHYHKGGYIPRMIHLAEIKDEGVVCYDGNHRKEVFNICNDETLICVYVLLMSCSIRHKMKCTKHSTTSTSQSNFQQCM